MLTRRFGLLFDSFSLRGLQLFWPVVLLPIVVASIDFLKSHPIVVALLLAAWGAYLLTSYGAVAWREAESTKRSCVDLSFHLTQGIAVILLPLALIGVLGLSCKGCLPTHTSFWLRSGFDLVALSGAVATVLMFFLFVPATAAALIGSSVSRIAMKPWQTESNAFRNCFGGVSLSLLMIVIGCCSVVTAMQVMYRFVVALTI
jgi:hypothetical protein